MSNKNFWINSATKWESQRYQGFFSQFIFSSLQYRRRYLAFILNQLPKGTRVVELGCGSGLLYAEVINKTDLYYTGCDISPAAIASAKQKFPESDNISWLCNSFESIKGLAGDFVISAGLLDWITDEQILQLAKAPFSYHCHSFSRDLASPGAWIHKVFSKLISRSSGVAYKPRKFSLEKIDSLFSNLQSLQLVSDKKLSFGAFVHNLPPTIRAGFAEFKVASYFRSKKNHTGFWEWIIKSFEYKAVKGTLQDLEGKALLEIGSGAGAYSSWLIDKDLKHFKCIDPFVFTPHFAPKTAAYFEATSLEALHASERFDVVLALGVLEFTENIESFTERMLLLARPGARLLILAPKGHGLVAAVYRLFHRLHGHVVSPHVEIRLIRFLTSQKKINFTKINGGFLNFLFIIRQDE